jgi:hypothetical protein
LYGRQAAVPAAQARREEEAAQRAPAEQKETAGKEPAGPKAPVRVTRIQPSRKKKKKKKH